MSDYLTTREPDKLIADILIAELDLSKKQVLLVNQKFDIPVTDKLFIAISYVGGQAIGNARYEGMVGSKFTETQKITMHHLVQIDVMSFGSEARTRKEEVIMALRSVKSQQLQDTAGLQIARIPGAFQNTSELEENNRMLTRFTMTVGVTSLYIKKQEISYYDTFPNAKVHVDKVNENNPTLTVPVKEQEVF